MQINKCPVCGQPVLKPLKTGVGQWIHSGVCNMFAAQYMQYSKGKLVANDRLKKVIEDIYKNLLNK